MSGVLLTLRLPPPRRALVSAASRSPNGKPIDPAAQYRIVLNNFMAEGGEGLGLSAGAIKTRARSPPSISMRSSTYLKTLPQPVHAPTEVRIRADGSNPMSDTMRVFVNGDRLRCARRRHRARRRRAARRRPRRARCAKARLLVTDSRGLPIDAATPLFNGAVLRLIPNRGRDAADPAARFDE